MAQKSILRKNQTIGAPAAEQDEALLKECFIDTGDLGILLDCDNPKRLLIGRTGTGKSAHIMRIVETQEHVVQIHPESLSLSYISNSSVLRFFTEAGVELDLFYKLLWRHVFCVEILKERFNITSEAKKKSFLQHIWALLPSNKKYETALDYLRKWGESFWEETEYRIKEVTSTLEQELGGALKGTLMSVAELDASASRRLTEETRKEIVQRGQQVVVNHVQIKELTNVMDLMRDIFLKDTQKRYYIVIDKLDEQWAEDTLRLKLIRALIETTIDFQRIPNVKIIVALRQDLIDRVFKLAKSSGFQEEKHRGSMFHIEWSSEQLTILLDTRINHVFRLQYSKAFLSHKDLLPARIGKKHTIEYMLERTLMRPRDLIQFFNTCIVFAEGRPEITAQLLREAEGNYSRDRLHAISYEWYDLYPNLPQLANLLKQRKDCFRLDEITIEELEENAIELLTSDTCRAGEDQALAEKTFDKSTMTVEEYRRSICHILYKTGLVGLKVESYLSISWSFLKGVTVSKSEISSDTLVYVHKTFWRALGITSRELVNQD